MRVWNQNIVLSPLGQFCCEKRRSIRLLDVLRLGCILISLFKGRSTQTKRTSTVPISKHELEEMNGALKNGRTIAQIAKKYPQYDYWQIYWEVNDESFLGKKRTITNRIKKLVSTKIKAERELLAEEAQELLNELYDHLKRNSKKLIELDRVLRK